MSSLQLTFQPVVDKFGIKKVWWFCTLLKCLILAVIYFLDLCLQIVQINCMQKISMLLVQVYCTVPVWRLVLLHCTITTAIARYICNCSGYYGKITIIPSNITSIMWFMHLYFRAKGTPAHCHITGFVDTCTCTL